MLIDPTGYRASDYYDERFHPDNVYEYHVGPPEESKTYSIWKAALPLCRGAVVEVGCGAGQFAKMAVDAGVEYWYGIDFSREAVARAKEQCPKVGFLVESVERWQIVNADTVVAVEVLEHLLDDISFLRRLPAGQRLVFSVPSFLTVGHARAFNRGEDDVRERYGDLLEFDHFERIDAPEGNPNFWTVCAARRK